MAFAVRNKNLNWKRVIFTDSKIFTWRFSNRAAAKKVWIDKNLKPVR